MLNIVFSIGVNERYKEEIENKIVEIGILFGRLPLYENSTGNVYFNCISDMECLQKMIRYLNYDFKDTAILIW